ncbi:MAG: hypothetical protein CL758_01175 [Chloroflexi bacterium]|nr:hypothetical protein [Chloroflexota bacterium]|tara:strand:+ start:6253 stop:6969 length:717 start_codon:yes stop_codon:yes gene_type:complete
MNLKNKIIVITGGSTGLGNKLAELFVKSDSKVIICSRKKPKNLLPNQIWKQVDISKQDEIKKFTNWIKKEYGKIDILINNAGFVGKLKTLDKINDSELEEYVKINFIGTFLMTKYSLRLIDKYNESWIINISSQASKKPVPNLSIYSATKSAVTSMTQALAKELEGTKLNCITICPAGINTAMREKLFGKEDALKQQSTKSVADLIKQIVKSKITIQNGSVILIKRGKIENIEISPNK